jgi:hypothetical protein
LPGLAAVLLNYLKEKIKINLHNIGLTKAMKSLIIQLPIYNEKYVNACYLLEVKYLMVTDGVFGWNP